MLIKKQAIVQCIRMQPFIILCIRIHSDSEDLSSIQGKLVCVVLGGY